MALNRAVAVAEVDGPGAALALVDGLDLDGYHLFHAIRADLLRRAGPDRRGGGGLRGGDRPHRERRGARLPAAPPSGCFTWLQLFDRSIAPKLDRSIEAAQKPAIVGHRDDRARIDRQRPLERFG